MKNLSPQGLNGGVFDVKAYRATGDSSTDDSAAFQAACDAAVAYAAVGGQRATVLVPPGQYKISSTFKIVGGDVTLSAYGAYIFAGSNNDLFRDWTSQDSSYTLNGNGLQILGGTWDLKGQNWGSGSNSTLKATGFSGFTLSNSSNIAFRDVTVRNVYNYHAIDLNTCRDVMIDNCRFEGFQNNFTWHNDVRVATTANGTIGTAFANGQTVDGVVLATGDRILIKDQTTQSVNGIYTVNASGSPTRATDMDASAEFNNAAVQVTSGTTNGGKAWYQTAFNPTVGTTNITWSDTRVGGDTSFNNTTRKWSEAIQIDCGPNSVATINVSVSNCYMGPAIDGSGLGSFGKLVGSHTTPSAHYSTITVANCFVDSPLDVGIRAFQWDSSTITGNVVTTSANSDAILVDTCIGTVVTGNTINQNATGNVVETGSGTGTNDNAHCIRITNSGSTDCIISGNQCTGNDASSIGIQVQGGARHKIAANQVYRVGMMGIYVSSATVNCSVVDNTVVGASRRAGTTGGIVVSNNAGNVGTYIADNLIRKFGSGTDAESAIRIEGTSAARTVLGTNDPGTDWGTGPFSAYNWNGNANVFTTWDVGAAGTGGTTVSSSTLTDIAGLGIANVPAGTWLLEAFIPVTTVGTVTSTVALKSSGAPATSTLNFEAYRTRSTVGGNATAFNSGITWASALTAGTTVVYGTATIVSTGSGAIQVQFAVSAGTSAQPLVGATIRLKRTA